MIKVASLNCRGLNKKIKRKSVFNQLIQYDIIFLQETYITNAKLKEWELDWNGKLYFVEGTNKSNGLITLINAKFPHDDIETIIKKDRIMCQKINIHDTSYYFINIYAPNLKKDKLSFLDELSSAISKLNSQNIIIGGDFNIVSDNILDILAGDTHDKELVKKLCKFRDKHER